MDISDGAKLKTFIEKIGNNFECAIILTEGLLVYLTENEVISLTKILYNCPSVKYWVLDILSKDILKKLQNLWNDKLSLIDATMKFAPKNPKDFFNRYCWKNIKFYSILDEAKKLNRDMPGAAKWRRYEKYMTNEQIEYLRNLACVLLLEKI